MPFCFGPDRPEKEAERGGGAPKLAGRAVTPKCGACGGDLGKQSYFGRLVLPMDAGGGEVGFAPQTLILVPLVCSHCGEGQVREQSVLRV